MIGERLLRVAHHAFIILVVLASTIVLSAQTVVDPQYVEFTPSADHDAVSSGGTPLVQRYSLSIFAVGSSVAFDTVDLGKPAPSAGIIRVNFIPLLHTQPTPNVVFEARVTAVGPGGSTASSVSNGFSFQVTAPPCAPTINSTGQSVGSGATTGSVGVTAGTGCAWTAASNAGWVTLTGATSGTGNGSVPYSIAANTTTSARTATLTVAGKPYTITQAALSCTFTLAATSGSVPASGGTGSTGVTSPAGCAWTGVSNSTSWLTVTGGASGSGNGTVAFSAAANSSINPRTGTLTIAGQSFNVTQPGLTCTYSIVPTSGSVPAGGGTGSTGVTALAGCAWTGVSNSTSWLTVTGGASGSGSGTVAFSATANSSTSSRTGTLTIAGQSFSVTQPGIACTYAISPTSGSVAAGGGTGSTGVTSPAGCAWTGVSNSTPWLTVTGGASGSGSGTVAFSATANSNTSSRTGTLTIAGQSFSVTQPGIACTFTLSAPSGSVPASGGTGSTGVTSPAGCAWTGVSNSTSWLTVTGGASGSGTGTVAFSAAANSSINPRTGTLTIAGQSFSVTQPGLTCTYSIVPTSGSVPAGGGTGSTAVTALAGCAWTGVSNSTPWLTVTSGASGSGSGTVAFSAAANSSTTSRTGTLTIAGQSFSVTQPGINCTFTLSAASGSVPAGGGTGSTGVTSAAGCAWTGISNNTPWLTVTGGASGSGSGTVAFSAAANSSINPRTGTLTIAGQSFSVTQAGAPCTYEVAPGSQTVGAIATSGSTSVTAPAGCSWTASSNNAGWLTVSSGATGNGSASVGFSTTANGSTSPRTGTMTIAGQTFTVTQAAAGCTFSLSSTSASIAASGDTASTDVTSLAGCPWSATSNAGWITVTNGASGNGSGTVSFSVAANAAGSTRSGTLTIASQTFTVSQGAATCGYSISPGSQSVAAGGGSGSTNVTAPVGCAWTASTSTGWLGVTSGGSGTGNGSVTFTAAANSTAQARTGTINVAGQPFTITQAGAACDVTLAPTSRTVAAAGGASSTSVNATTGCAWTAVSNTGWLTITGGASGNGNGTVSFSAAANTSAQGRAGSLTIGGDTLTVNQDGGSCSFTVSPTAPSMSVAGGNLAISVTAGAGCSWTSSSTATWVVATNSSGSGSGSAAFTVAANMNSSARSAALSIAGRIITVTQAANTCSYTLSPGSRSIGAEGGTGTITVSTGSGCPWAATTSQAWVSLSGTGNSSGSVTYTVQPNTTGINRSALLIIGTQSFVVSQGVTTTSTPTPAVPGGLRIVVGGL